MKEHYFLVEYSYINRGKIVVCTVEGYEREDAYTVLMGGLRMSRIVTVKNITKLARKPHSKHLRPIESCNTALYNTGQWAWEYID